ncbi:pyridoxal-dependent decarboxylase, exosortase A system-associated [Litorilituus sediminis]|uniref:Pyridoxal-dependent decarboxylase, exosortase A system-associated n=1 Tax=Litorilituus sediminis TaxID=718192 RepID=A0A4P6P6I4_9GAMM|nr:pyridoxal-dependent decarboxylase, exosortase A system-associated [Litorilituus sediminis]QBG36638.1 pyridoxal-dependent decarboxylase, exosortase A system-associated [Litorilituus sediminis]
MSTDKSLTIEPTIFSQEQHVLKIGKHLVSNIDNMLGSTPFYAYDKDKIIARTQQLTKILPKQVKLHYAIKANPYPSLVHLLSDYVSGFDVASKQELLLALQTKIKPEHISFAGPGKSLADIQAAIISGVTLHIESETELARVIESAKSLAICANIALRVNPKFELKASGMKMSGGAKPFGIDEENIGAIIKALPAQYIKLRGFHIFSGSQNLNAQAIIECQKQTFALAKQLIDISKNTLNEQLDYINIGGGFGVPYFKAEQPLATDKIMANLAELIALYKSTLQNTQIVLELGRYLVAEAGVYICKITDIKHSRGTKYLVCDGGLHHHLANSGNFGQVIRKNYPVAIANKMATSLATEEVSVVGPLCTPLDILAEKVTLPKADIGDYFVVFQSGAYGASASPQGFLSQPKLSEILL